MEDTILRCLKMNKIPIREVCYVAGAVLAAGIQWGMLSTKLSAQESKITEIAPLKEAVPVILSQLVEIKESQREMKRDIRELRSSPIRGQ